MEALAFDHLVQARHQQLAALPDDRKGTHTRYAIKDAALGAFAVFLIQSPSLLAYQRTMQQAKGRSNAEGLFGMGDMPWDNQIGRCSILWPRPSRFPCLPGCTTSWTVPGTCPSGGCSRTSC